ncbi:single-stranded DNA-binding protein 4 [Grus japonensis]|uniref:Single-stranded DNA-binding protein 4 n=1 Tax=Grus japonensis TaxID=30415 RepID=A0ABC9YAH7_GRUJA
MKVRLALYVYEYLLHVGAQKSAQTFLSEIRWEKNITLGEPPGFLHSWWCVFWDLYCAAPERRETCEHSSEAKAFHDYLTMTCIVNAPSTQVELLSIFYLQTNATLITCSWWLDYEANSSRSLDTFAQSCLGYVVC